MPPRLHDTVDDQVSAADTSAAAVALPIAGEVLPTFVETRDEAFVARFLTTVRPWLTRFFEPEVRGLENVPEGAALLVANHNAGVLMPDVWILGDALFQHMGSRGLPYALAHDVLFDVNGLRQALEKLGGVRASPESAHALFAAGHKALVYPGGDREVMRPYRDRHRIVFGPRRGYIKMAIREGVPVVPVVTAGAHEAFMVLDDGGFVARRLGLPKWARINVLPTVLSFPWGLTFGFPPPYLPVPTRIVMDVLPPIHFERSGEEAAVDDAYVERCHDRVVRAMQARFDEIVSTEEIGVRARVMRRWPKAEPIGRFLEDLADGIMARSPFAHAPLGRT
ncbi:MAG: acyltransferase family protein [Deltaproteobacteria bacterium]|nr:acyltransferase family protein [Deltaproteobacteria bacterium]